jgi:hypothetical protein
VTAQASEIVICKGQHYNLLPGSCWHLTHATQSTLRHNVFLYEGLCRSISLDQAALPGIVSWQSLKGMIDEKEKTWERVRLATAPDAPTRNGAIFLFDDQALAQDRVAKWFGGQDRILLEARIVKGSSTLRTDAHWLDADRSHWEASARSYWSGEMSATPSPEILVHGAVYFPGWKNPPFGLFAGMMPETSPKN